MPDAIDYERAFDPDAEPFLRVVTEALRAGPGSPEWHEVVTTLRGGGVGGVIDYDLLMRVRQDLESGRAFRAVRAGPGFTAKLMTRLDDEVAARGRRPPVLTPSVLATIGGVGLVLLLAGMAFYLLRTPPPATSPAAEALAGTVFGTTAQSVPFTIAGDEDLPTGWRAFGPVRFDADRGLRPARAAAGRPSRGGVVTGPLSGAAVAVEAVIRGRRGDGVSVQVFVADAPPDADAPPAELAGVLRDNRVGTVLPNGRFAGVRGDADGRGETVVRVAVQGDVAVVTAGGRRLYAGPSGLTPGQPRYVGVRFLVPRGDAGGDLAVQSVRVLRP